MAKGKSRGPRGRRGATGKRGSRGKQGERGEQGERGAAGTSAPVQLLTAITKELEAAQRDLRVQFTRIAQLQAEVDVLRSELKQKS
jgi:hypothetical protein